MLRSTGSSLLGSFEIGGLISYVLFGVTTTQTYIYHTRFPDDPYKLKVLVRDGTREGGRN